MVRKGYLTDLYQNRIKTMDLQFLMFLSTLGILLLALYSFINVTRGNSTAGIIELGLAMCLLISLINLIITAKPELTRVTGAVVLAGIVITNTITGGFNNHAIFWSYAFPCVIFLLLGSRNGIYMTLILFSILATILTLKTIGSIKTPYNNIQLATHYASLGFMTLLTYVYQKTVEKGQDLTKEINRRLTTTNQELAKQMEQYDDAQKKIFEFSKSVSEQNSEIEKMQHDLIEIRNKVDTKTIRKYTKK